MNGQLKLAHKVVDVLKRANRKIWVILLRYNVNKQESSHAQVQIIATNKEDVKLQKIVYFER